MRPASCLGRTEGQPGYFRESIALGPVADVQYIASQLIARPARLCPWRMTCDSSLDKTLSG
jgi:hypothetical protein